jgi:hypothetical protein
MTTQRSGRLVFAIALIGLGIVFLVRQATDLPWAEAWPLLIILVGVTSLVSTALGRRNRGFGLWAYTFPVAWIFVGSVLLASTTGAIDQSPYDVVVQWAPWFLIVLGVWFVIGAVLPIGRGPIEALELPLGAASEAAIKVKFGAGELTAGAAGPGHLVDGRFEGGVNERMVGPGRVELWQDTTYGLPWFEQPSNWTVGFSAEVPLDLTLDTGASRARLDLAALRLRTLDLRTGASETRVRLPRAAGVTSVRVQAGAAAVTLEVPATVAARIRSRVGIGSTQVDQGRFPRTATGYESPDYATAANRVDIDLQGGVGSMRVVGVA